MPSRLYFPYGAAAATSPTYDPSWGVTTQAVRRRLSYVRTGTNNQTHTLRETPSTTTVDVLGDQYVSDPLPGPVTISGTVTVATAGRETAVTGTDAKFRVVVKVVTSAGALRGVLLQGITPEAMSYPYFKYKSVSGTMTTVEALAGDRIVVERGYRFYKTSATEFVGTFMQGDNFLNVTEANPDSSTFSNDVISWAEFSQDEIWGPNIARLGSETALVLEKPVRTPTKTASTLSTVMEKPVRTPTRMGSAMTQVMIPKAGQVVPGLYAVGFPETEPRVLLPDGRWVPIRPRFSFREKVSPPLLVSWHSIAAGYADVADGVLPTDLLVMFSSSKRTPLPQITGLPSGIPDVTWSQKFLSADHRNGLWFGLGATGPGRATIPLSVADGNRTSSIFVVRNVQRVLAHTHEQYTTTATPAASFDAPTVTPVQIALLHTNAGTSAVISSTDKSWVQLGTGGSASAARINPLQASGTNVQISHSSGIAGLMAVIG